MTLKWIFRGWKGWTWRFRWFLVRLVTGVEETSFERHFLLFLFGIWERQFWLTNKRPTWCHLLFYFTYYVLNMFRTLIYPSSGACDYSVELPHWSYCSWFDVCWSFGVVGMEWYPCCRLQACNTDTTTTQPHRNSNTHRTKNNTTNVVIQQNSRKLLMMDILMSETCWIHNK